MGELRGRFAPSPSGRMHLGNLFSGLLAFWAGQLEKPEPVTPAELARIFDWSKVPKNDITVGNEL